MAKLPSSKILSWVHRIVEDCGKLWKVVERKHASDRNWFMILFITVKKQ